MRILIVAEDSGTARLVRNMLELEGYTVMEASNGVSVMRIINEHVPDLIFLDINLPGIDGITLAKLIKSGRRTDKVPIIALVRDEKTFDRDRFSSAGCECCISKPFNVKKVLSIVRAYRGEKDR